MLHHRIYRTLAMAALFFQASCGAITGPESDFTRAQSRWASQRPVAYDYTLKLSCFCGSEATRAVVILVRGDIVESRTYADNGAVVPAQYNSVFPTIEGMFDRIAAAIDQKAAKVDVSYDPALGYPTSIAFDGSLNVADDESWYTLTNFHIR
jgi:hypothetical protein